ncbi:MAG: MFS transporter [Flavihumibacter sp.]|nr:MFS transporter [Flavihumibacter sp.]
MEKKNRIILLLLACLNFTHILDFMIMMPLGNYLMPYFQISPRQFSFLVASYPISAFVSGLVAAFFVDGFDRKKILLIGYTGFLVGTIACGFAPSFELLFAARTLTGLFGGLIGAQVLSIISDIFPYEQRGKAMGAVMSAFAVASTIGVPFALYLANLFSWHAPFLLVGGLGVVIVPLLVKFVPPMTKHITEKKPDQSPFHSLQLLQQNPQRIWALIFSGLIMMGHFIIIPFINPYMEFNNGYSKAVTPLIYLVGGIASFVAATVLGRIADAYGKLKVFTACIFISLALVLVLTNLPAIAFSIVLVFFAAWFIVSTGRGVTAQAMVSNVVPPQERGSFMSFNSSIQQLGTGIASVVGGLIIQKGADGKLIHYNWLGYFSIVVLSIALWLGYTLFKGSDVKKKDLVPGS